MNYVRAFFEAVGHFWAITILSVVTVGLVIGGLTAGGYLFAHNVAAPLSKSLAEQRANNQYQVTQQSQQYQATYQQESDQAFQQIGWSYNGWSNGQVESGVVGQMDPNGIYAPTSSAGTWIICLDGQGNAYINRFEPLASTIGGPAEWVQNPKNGQHIQMTGAPTALATTVDGKHKAVDTRPTPKAKPSS